MLEKEFIPYEEALVLKELGFNEPCFGEYRQWDGCRPWLQIYQDGEGAESSFTTECKAPTFSQAFRWFGKKYKMTSSVRSYFAEAYFYEIYESFTCEIVSDIYNSYEEAELACLRKLIEIVKEKQ